jgi:hypothetical protein
MPKKSTTKSFIESAVLVHGDKYNYGLVEYTTALSPVSIICNVGHIFIQRPNNHLRGQGCPICAGRAMNTTLFIEKANLKHGVGKYNYSEVDYVDSKSKVTITCKSGHTFQQTPNQHLDGAGCPTCANQAAAKRMLKPQEKFIEECRKMHGDRYDYSEVVYKGDSNKVMINCSKGHKFEQKAGHHLAGSGCPYCMTSGYRVTLPGSLYFLKCGNIFKIGITNRDVNTRLKEINKSSGKNFELVYSQRSEDGVVPYAAEYAMKFYMKSLYKLVDESFDGSTECFLDVDEDFMIRIAKQHFINLEVRYGD